MGAIKKPNSCQRGVSHSDKEVSIVLSKFDSMSLINAVQRKEINDE